MTKNSKKRPILCLLHGTDHEPLIYEVYNFVKCWDLRWLAFEQLEMKYNGNIIHHMIRMESLGNNILLYELPSEELVALLAFDRTLATLPASNVNGQFFDNRMAQV